MQNYLINAIATYIIVIILLFILKPQYIFKNKKISFPIISVIISIIIFLLYYYYHVILQRGLF